MSSRKNIYRGEVVDLGLETVNLPDQKTMQLEVVRHPGGAAVVAVDQEQKICLLKQFRHAAGGWLWELPAGKIDPGEAAEQTARRELQEEAGVTAGEWRPLGSFLSTPGFCDERIHLYLASNLTPSGTAHHPHEFIEIHWVDREQVMAWIREGKIVDGKTIIGLLLSRL